MKVTNMKFTEDEKFRTRCEAAGVNPTKRQASKFRRGIGAAFNITFSRLQSVLLKRNQLIISKTSTT